MFLEMKPRVRNRIIFLLSFLIDSNFVFLVWGMHDNLKQITINSCF